MKITNAQQHYVQISHRISHKWDNKCGKVKAIPLQAWTGPEVSRSLRLPDFKTFGT